MNLDLQKQLISLKERDIKFRNTLLAEGSLYNGYDSKLESLHMENARILDKIVETVDWPGRSLVGKDGADAAFILAQNSISMPNLQRKFLLYLKNAAKKGEATYLQVACLEDRILFNEGKPQKYGMLYDWDKSGNLVANVDDIDLANERRKQLGLKTVEEATEIHRNSIEKEGGVPPSDYDKHKKLEDEWARRVGWR